MEFNIDRSMLNNYTILCEARKEVVLTEIQDKPKCVCLTREGGFQENVNNPVISYLGKLVSKIILLNKLSLVLRSYSVKVIDMLENRTFTVKVYMEW